MLQSKLIVARYRAATSVADTHRRLSNFAIELSRCASCFAAADIHERVERMIVERSPQADEAPSLPAPTGGATDNEATTESGREINYQEPPMPKPYLHWWSR